MPSIITTAIKSRLNKLADQCLIHNRTSNSQWLGNISIIPSTAIPAGNNQLVGSWKVLSNSLVLHRLNKVQDKRLAVKPFNKLFSKKSPRFWTVEILRSQYFFNFDFSNLVKNLGTVFFNGNSSKSLLSLSHQVANLSYLSSVNSDIIIPSL